MAHGDIRRLERAKAKVYNTIDENFEYEELKKKVKKDALTMSRSHLGQKWPRPLIIEALKEMEVANG